ncbi:hypothetical protein Esi_0358_0032 [Ectocarpus siliculosus]|uniref:Uncharacterized protein n=1 Tax=Ectocarpus siliculosus TaxID=2880 RepID=D7FZ97_ECTSI|nr:hypothetical protein Esi_0358_0032 [Ectocarpus siliculosus]|eukprot:CBJ32714.1 hypothetical protein Esi_0358_0032 [Ectocarpus siliculosus]
MVYAAPAAGSEVFATPTGRVPWDEEGRATGPLPQKQLTLLAANERLMAKVEDFRSEIILRRLVKKNALREGRTLKKSKISTLMGFLPFGKRGFLHRRARGRAEAHLGEATLKLTSKSILEVSVDGTVVLRKKGPSFFGFRRTDPSYELQVIEEGIEVSRRGDFVWGVKAEDIF